MKSLFFYLVLGAISACSNSPSTDDGGTDAGNDVSTPKDAANDVVFPSDSSPDDSSTTDSSTTDSSITDSSTKDSSTTDASDAGPTKYTLTINDYLSWCNVSVNGVDAGSSPGTYQFSPDASVSLHGDTADSLNWYWGYWQAPTLGDGGPNTNMNVTIQMNGNVTVLACCPDQGTPLSCP
jgi:hypothetical protein